MLRVPNRAVYSSILNNTATLVDTFNLPLMDFDSLVVQWNVPVLSAGNVSLYIQTTPDGTIYYDVATLGNISSVTTTATSLWATIPVNAGDGGYAGSCNASATVSPDGTTANKGKVNKLPLLSNSVRVQYVFSSITTGFQSNLTIYANNQSAHS